MSYQQEGGYQYSNVPSIDHPLDNNNGGGTNNTNSNSNSNVNAATSSSAAPSQQQQQQPPPPPPQQQYSNGGGPSVYSPRNYLPSYNDYMHNPNLSTSSGFGGGSSYPDYYGPAAYLESERKSRRNRILMGFAVILFFLGLMRHPVTKNDIAVSGNTAAADTVPASDADKVSTADTDKKGSESVAEKVKDAKNDETQIPTDEGADNTEDLDDGSTSTYTTTDSDSESTEVEPTLTYLLTYPMSGTSFTMKIIETVTGMALATNYAHFKPYHDKDSPLDLRPICADYPPLMKHQMRADHTDSDSITSATKYGYPFWTTSYETGTIPTNNILTLSHCTGFCTYPCKPNDYIRTQESFEESCREVLYTNSTTEKNEAYHTPRNSISAIIHLIRDPLSNVVSRFHEYLNTHPEYISTLHEKNPGKRAKHENFREWCHEMDNNQALIDEEKLSYLFSSEMKHDMKKIPCHTEFLKYVEWHNHVVEMKWARNHTMIQVYFEHYANVDKKITEAKKMAEFLGYEVKESNLPVFLGGKMYRDNYYTEAEIKALKEFIEVTSFDETWDMLKTYFE